MIGIFALCHQVTDDLVVKTLDCKLKGPRFTQPHEFRSQRYFTIDTVNYQAQCYII